MEITATIDKSKLNNSVKILTNDIENSVRKKALVRWRTNITATMTDTYKKHARTSQQGFRNLSQMLSRKSIDNKDGIEFEFFVNPAKEGLGLSAEKVEIWKSIAHQTEFGETRDGSKKIRPNKAKILAIPVHPKAKRGKDGKSKSPGDFKGKWIKVNRNILLIEDLVSGKKLKGKTATKPRQPKSATKSKSPRKGRVRKKGTTPVVLFVGKESVNVRRATPYWKPTVDEMFGGGNNSKAIKRLKVVLSEELGIDESDIRVV